MTKLYVGVTDKNWFDQLQEQRPDEVNFWKPGGTTGFRALAQYEPFLFKLHSPLNFVVGGGFFVSFSALPLSIAWDAFGEKNGVRTKDALFRRIIRYRREELSPGSDPTIGCIILTQPFFFSREEWIPTPAGWASNIVQGRTYDLASPEGSALWSEVRMRLEGMPSIEQPHLFVAEGQRPVYETQGRLGQGAFRVLVTDAYTRRCAITGERTLPVLEAAHIVPYSVAQENNVANGLLLRADLHKLFDQGLIGVTPGYLVKVSSAIRERFENGRDYYALDNSPVRVLPAKSGDQPDRDRLGWHYRHVFVGD